MTSFIGNSAVTFFQLTPPKTLQVNLSTMLSSMRRTVKRWQASWRMPSVDTGYEGLCLQWLSEDRSELRPRDSLGLTVNAQLGHEEEDAPRQKMMCTERHRTATVSSETRSSSRKQSAEGSLSTSAQSSGTLQNSCLKGLSCLKVLHHVTPQSLLLLKTQQLCIQIDILFCW